jgi:hypothetical protein
MAPPGNPSKEIGTKWENINDLRIVDLTGFMINH